MWKIFKRCVLRWYVESFNCCFSGSYCSFPLLCCCLVAKSRLTLFNLMNCSLPGSSVHEILQARILEQVTISYSRGSSWPRDQNPISCVSCTGGQILYHCTTLEAPFPFCSCTQTRMKVGTEFKPFSLPDAIQGQEVSQQTGKNWC